MKIGICAGADHLEEMLDCGFDYVEYPINGIGEMREEDYVKLLEKTRGLKANIYAGNCFFPWDSRLVGEHADMVKTSDYADKALKRMYELGCKVCVIGNGGARDPDEGMGIEDTYKEFAQVIRKVGLTAKSYGITIAIEALYFGESKICNTLEETARFARSIDMENVGITADYYHFNRNNESTGALEKVYDVLKHVHIADMEGRRYPMPENENAYKGMFDVLKRIGYTGGISIEGESGNDRNAEGKRAAAILKKLSR